MTIERDNGIERQTRVDQMIQEFRAAQSRRVAAATRAPVAPTPDGTTPLSASGAAR